VRRQTYGYLPSRRASPPLDRYLIRLLDNRGIYVCEQVAQGCCLKGERPRFEPAKFRVASPTSSTSGVVLLVLGGYSCGVQSSRATCRAVFATGGDDDDDVGGGGGGRQRARPLPVVHGSRLLVRVHFALRPDSRYVHSVYSRHLLGEGKFPPSKLTILPPKRLPNCVCVW